MARSCGVVKGLRVTGSAGCWWTLVSQAALVGLFMLLVTSCGPTRSLQSQPTSSAPAPSSRPPQAASVPPVPASLTLLAGDQDARGHIAVIVGEVGTGAPSRQAPPPYAAVFGHRPLVPTTTPADQPRTFRSTLDALAKRGVQEVDVWAYGLDGLVVRQAVERLTPGQPPVRRLVLVDTPHRGLSPSGWPAWEAGAPPVAAQLPTYAVAGSSFLLELNSDPLADLSGVEYLTIWRDRPQSAPRASVMQLPRRGVQIVLRLPDEGTPLASLLEAPVTAARAVLAGGAAPRGQLDSPTRHAAEAPWHAPRDAGVPPPPLRAFLTGGPPAAVSHQAETWVRFAPDAQTPAIDRRLWHGRPADLTAETLLGMTDPGTIAYAPETNELVITGYEDYARAPLTADLLWTAVRAYHRNYPAVSIDPPGPVEAQEAVVRYEGDTRGTRLGGLMFEPDRVMKALALGQDNITRTALSSGVVGHKSIAAATTLGPEAPGTLWRLWFEPERWHAREEDPLSALIDARVHVRWERMTPDYVPSQPVVEFTERLSAAYRQYAREQPAFDALEQAAVLIAMAKWVVEANLDVLVGPGEPPSAVATPERTPLLQVPTESRTGPLAVVLQGGVVFCPRLRHVRDPGSRSRALTVAALSMRPPGAGAWEFRDEGRVMRAVAVPAQERKRGVPLGIRNARDHVADPAPPSDTCIEESFRLLGPVITAVLLDDATDPPEVVLDGIGFGPARDGMALFNGKSLRTPTWTPKRVVALLSSTPEAGTLVLRAAGRDSNPVTFTLVPDWERRTPPQITLVNRATFPLRVAIRPVDKGSTRDVDVPQGGTQVTRVVPGRYKVTAQATDQWSVGAVHARDDEYERGRAYTLTYEPRTFPLGALVIKNDTGAPVTLQVEGPAHKRLTVPEVGLTTVQLSPGTYTIKVSSRCGTKTETTHISTGSTHTLSYRCITFIR